MPDNSTVNSAQAARLYISKGFAPIPVPERQKNPGRPGWQKLRLTEEDVPRYFPNGGNIGLLNGEPSGGLACADVDGHEAQQLAGRFLDPTRTSGRESAPDSHWWYFAAGAPHTVFKDLDGSMILELRSTGHQTLVWPSVHPSGERYEWTQGGLDFAKVESDDLLRQCRELATAALIARHLPPCREQGGGGRHDIGHALTGFLYRRGLDEPTIGKILHPAWDAKGFGGNEKARREAHSDLDGIIRDTAAKIREGRPATGGRRLEELLPGMPDKIADYWGWSGSLDDGELTKIAANRKRNQADRLIDYALDSGAELFVDQVGAPHVLVEGEAVPLGTRSYNWLRSLMWEEEEISVGGEALKTAAGTLGAFAVKSGKVRELHTRSAFHDGAVYFQLRPGRVVRIDRSGWDFEDDPPVVFRSVPNLKPLPDPERGGTLDTLEDLINLKGERAKRMCKAYAATLPLPHIPRPILQTTGVMGSGKTTAGRVIKRLFDPTAPETVRVDPRDFLQKASHSYIFMLDNVNSVPEWAVDVLCRLVTGEADSKRSLYTDDEDFIYEMKRAVLLNGINAPTERGDAQDRTLPVELERIPDHKRRSEEDLWAQFEREHSRLLGAVFDTLAKAIRERETLRLHRRPRLADWGEYAAAVYEVMDWGVEQFLEDWGEVVKVQNQGTLDGSPVAQAVLSFMESRNKWSGLASDLHLKLEVEAEELNIDIKRDKNWPKSPSWLWRRMREVLPLLVAMGVQADKQDSEKGSIIRLVKTDGGPDSGDEDKDQVDEDDPGSTEGDASRNASRENPGYSSGSESTGSTGSIRGHSSTTRTQTEEGKAKNQAENGAEKDRGPKVHSDASSASSGPFDTANTRTNEKPLSSDLQPGESATLEELRARRERETKSQNSETFGEEF